MAGMEDEGGRRRTFLLLCASFPLVHANKTKKKARSPVKRTV
jgi:hypothetical protein